MKKKKNKPYRKLPSGKIQYRGQTFNGFNKPKNAPPGDKHKKVVLAKDGDKIKLIRFGARGYSDFTKHKDPKRRERYLKRHSAIKTKDGKKAINNKLQAAYWAKKVLW